MFRFKILISIVVFTLFLISTSIIKNQTRELEKKISNLNEIINKKEKDLNESQLDFSYLTSPSILDLQIEHLDTNEYIPMEYSNIFLSLSDFLNLNQKLANKNSNAEKDQK